jgi:hypothetical protein
MKQLVRIVVALKAAGYTLRGSAVSVSDQIEWNKMVSEAILDQHEPFSKEEDAVWSCLVVEARLDQATSLV